MTGIRGSVEARYQLGTTVRLHQFPSTFKFASQKWAFEKNYNKRSFISIVGYTLAPHSAHYVPTRWWNGEGYCASTWRLYRHLKTPGITWISTQYMWMYMKCGYRAENILYIDQNRAKGIYIASNIVCQVQMYISFHWNQKPGHSGSHVMDAYTRGSGCDVASPYKFC